MLDLIIHGGSVIDGTGTPAYRADVGVKDGRIVKVGEVRDPARRTIDAQGKIIAPGFIENHTHYDVQILWDKALTPSPEHGFTTAIAGNCGLTMAPMPQGEKDWMYDLLASVETVPRVAMDEGITESWDSFADYMDLVDRPLGLNIAFMVGHSALRRRVMGPAASYAKATTEQIEQMKALLAEGLKAGGFGFSSGMARTHYDGDGVPTPPRHAAHEELVALSEVLRDYPGTVLQAAPATGYTGVEEDDRRLLANMSIAADRPLFYLALVVQESNKHLHERMLTVCDEARAKGGLVYCIAIPNSEQPVRLEFNQSFFISAFPEPWPTIAKLSIPERMKKYKDPAVRHALNRAILDHPERTGYQMAHEWQYMIVNDVPKPEMEHLVGRTVGEIAAERGLTPFDAILEISVEGDLRVGFFRTARPTDWERKTFYRSLRDPRVSWGGGDAGAHYDLLTTADQGIRTIQELVQKEKTFTLEEVIHHYSYAVAQKWGIKDRGAVREGYWADLIVMEGLDKLDVSLMQMVHDLPGGGHRLRTRSTGIERVLCNGREVFADGSYTGDLPGRLLRAGRDTVTVSAHSALN
jgi:N-acyl-D-aspartate/D-glutamate deacylase